MTRARVYNVLAPQKVQYALAEICIFKVHCIFFLLDMSKLPEAPVRYAHRVINLHIAVVK